MKKTCLVIVFLTVSILGNMNSFAAKTVNDSIPNPVWGIFSPLYFSGGNGYHTPQKDWPWKKLNLIIISFAHVYPANSDTDFKHIVPGTASNVQSAYVLGYENARNNWKDVKPPSKGDFDVDRIKKIVDMAKNSETGNSSTKFLISLGWGSNDDWTKISTDLTSGANKFPDSVVKYITTNNLDGFDIDWETPNGTITQENFTKVCQNIRIALDSQGQKDGKLYIFSITPAEYTSLTETNLKYFDLINPQSYYGNGADYVNNLTGDTYKVSEDNITLGMSIESDDDLSVKAMNTLKNLFIDNDLRGLYIWNMGDDEMNNFKYINEFLNKKTIPTVPK